MYRKCGIKINTLLFVYAYFQAEIHDPLRNADEATIAYLRNDIPIQIKREEGWYLIARLQKEQQDAMLRLQQKYKQLKVIERLVAIPFAYVLHDLENKKGKNNNLYSRWRPYP